MNKGTWPRPNSDGDPAEIEKLRLLYIELDGIDIAIENAMARVEHEALVIERAKVLGNIKRMERERDK
jgi:hypothetical protein